MKIDNRKYFKNVPKHQKELLRNFICSHPYKQIRIKKNTYDYISSGKGNRTLILLHGAMFNPYMWFYPITKLEKELKIIAPRFPVIGMGANESVNLIKSILDFENIKKANILGYSYGGGVAQYFAEIFPDYVEKLILSHTGILKRNEAIDKIEKMIRIIRFLPSFTINIIKWIRTKSGKESDWFKFRKAFFNFMFQSISKKIFINHFKKNLEFLNDIKHLPVGKVTWHGETIILGTNSDKDTFLYFEKLKEIYQDCEAYVFDKPGGHHMIFLYPEEYTDILRKYLLQE